MLQLANPIITIGTFPDLCNGRRTFPATGTDMRTRALQPEVADDTFYRNTAWKRPLKRVRLVRRIAPRIPNFFINKYGVGGAEEVSGPDKGSRLPVHPSRRRIMRIPVTVQRRCLKVHTEISALLPFIT